MVMVMGMFMPRFMMVVVLLVGCFASAVLAHDPLLNNKRKISRILAGYNNSAVCGGSHFSRAVARTPPSTAGGAKINAMR
jgi:hypothetical protein